jgi:hypothetical protein
LKHNFKKIKIEKNFFKMIVSAHVAEVGDQLLFLIGFGGGDGTICTPCHTYEGGPICTCVA